MNILYILINTDLKMTKRKTIIFLYIQHAINNEGEYCNCIESIEQ